jgi:Fic family protein
MGVDFGRFRTTADTVWRPARDGFSPRYRVEPGVFEDLRAVERADQELRHFQPDAAEARRILEDALSRNAYGTASIEGGPLTLEEVESLLARGPTPDAVDRPEEREILNYARFVEALPRRAPPATVADLRALHRELFAGVLPDAGALKTRPNFIGRRPAYEVVFVPTMPERVEEELAQALAWHRHAPEHPLVKTMVLFHEVQGIHPFRDGNGRAGRALATSLLHHAGYAGVRYALVDYRFNADRDGYYGNLSAVERNGWDYTPWIAYMARVLRETFEDALARFLFERRLPAGLNDRQRQVALWLARLDRDKPGRRVKFNDVHAAFPTVAPRTLKRDLATLRDEGVVVLEGERKAARYHFALPPG